MSRMSSALTRAAQLPTSRHLTHRSAVPVSLSPPTVPESRSLQSDAGTWVCLSLSSFQGTARFAGMGVTATGQIRSLCSSCRLPRAPSDASSFCVNLACAWRWMIATNTDERFLPLNCHADRGVALCALRINLSPGVSVCDRSLQLPHVSTSFQIALQTIPVRQSHMLLYGGPSLGTRYIPELWWGSCDPFVSFTSGKSVNVRLSLLPISPLPLIRLNNSEDSLLTPSIRQTRSTSGSGCLHRKPKSGRRSRSTCSHQAGRGIDLDLGRRGGRHRRPSTTIVERPSQSSTAKVNQGREVENKGKHIS